MRSRGSAPQKSDSEIITVSLIIETFFQGHEEVGYAFVTQYLRDMFPDLVDLDRFNVRHRWIAVMEQIHRLLRNHKLDPSNPFRIVDSAPITLSSGT